MEIDVYTWSMSQGPVNFVLAQFFIFLLQGLQCREYCNVDTFQADCGDHQVVLMTSAKYGRIHIGKCIQRDLGHMGCQVDVLAQLDVQCSGRRRCSIANLDAALRNVNPCSELVKYLDAVYKCIPVMSVSSYQCQRSHAIFAPPPPSHLANIVTKEAGCGGQGHPWVIEVDVTKRINITLIDFGMLTFQDPSSCIEYGVIREPGRPGASKICGKAARMRPIYLSQSHRVEITLESPDVIGQAHFLVEYEAVGCPNPLGANMWLHQENGHATVGCHGDPIGKWQIKCIGDAWIGHIGHCNGTGGGSGDHAVVAFFKTMPKDLMIYIFTGVGVLLLLLIIIVIMFCTRRFCPKDRPDVYELAERRDQPVRSRPQQQQTTSSQQTPHPQQSPNPHQTILTPDNVGHGSPLIQREPMAQPLARPTGLPPIPKKTPPRPTPRRTLGRRQQEGQFGVDDRFPVIHESPDLESPGTSRRLTDTNHRLPRRPSGRNPEHGVPNEMGGATARTDNRPNTYRKYPSNTARSMGRPQPSAPEVDDMGFV